ncbi:MAG: CARDB domain-containing protein [Haloarculaceae archaeon]
MPSSNPESSIRDNTRGVSEVIGFVFVFGILIILLSINQAQIVPQENAEIEFEHFQTVRNDLIEVRSSISTAGQADVSQFPTVKLGTDYPPRIFAVNPTTPIGTLQTSEKYNITITNQSGATTHVSTRFLEYRPRYNELDIGSTWYENSVLYLDDRERGGIAIIEDQNLITDGNVTRITALQNDFQKSGTERVTLELYPVQTTTADDIPTGNLTVTLPTRLTGDQYWNEAFDSETVYLGVENDSYDDGIHALNLSINTSKDSQELQLNTVGIQSEPSEGGAKQNVGVGDDGSDSGNYDVTIASTNSPVNSGDEVTVTATIENTGDESTNQTIELDIEEQPNPVDTQAVTLSGGNSMDITLNWETEKNDHNKSPYNATVSSNNDSDTEEIVVNKGAGNS